MSFGSSDPRIGQVLPGTTLVVAPTPAPESTLEWDTQTGLLKGVTYTRRADGSIDWRALIPREFLGVKRECEAKVMTAQGVKSRAEIDASKVSDGDLMVLLGGWKRLLLLRGYNSLTCPCTFVTPEKAVATCTIIFAPTFETRGVAVTYSWSASASYANTTGEISQAFLESIACNRAFSLCLRGFLNINIVGKDEMNKGKDDDDGTAAASVGGTGARPNGGNSTGMAGEPGGAAGVVTNQGGFGPQDTLARRCQDYGITFEAVKKAAVQYTSDLTAPGVIDTWLSFNDIDKLDAFVILGKIQAKRAIQEKEAKEKAESAKPMVGADKGRKK